MRFQMELEEVKEAVRKMKEEKKDAIVTNAGLTKEASDWIQSQKMAVKERGNITVIAEKEECLPSDEEFEKFEEIRKLAKAISEFSIIPVDELLLLLIMEELFS